MWRQTMAGMLVGVAALAAAPAARAQDQSLVLNFGGFVPRGADARADGDVLNADRCLNTTGFCQPLLFDISDFNGFTFSGEWLVGLGADLSHQQGGMERKTQRCSQRNHRAKPPPGRRPESRIREGVHCCSLCMVLVKGVVLRPSGLSSGLLLPESAWAVPS